MTRQRPLGLISFFLVAALPLAAQATPGPRTEIDTDVIDLLDLLSTPVTTASKRAERMIESPSVVSVVSRGQFQDYGWTSVNEALYSLPGFAPSQDFDRRTVSSRGLFEGWNNNHLLMLVDGMPFNDNMYGTAFTSEVTPAFFIKNLEVVRGPGSALYGSNSTNGVVQLKTITPGDLRGDGEAQLRFGQKGERVYDFAMGKTGELASGIMAFNSYATDGICPMDYDVSGRTNEDGSLSKFRVNDRRNSQYGWAKLEGEGALKGWAFQFHHQSFEFQTGHGWLNMIPDTGETMQEKRQLVALSFTGKLGSSWTQEYMLRHQRHDLSWNLRFIPSGVWELPLGLTEVLETGSSDWFGRAQWSLDLPKNASFLFGVEGSRFLYTGDRVHYGVNYDFSAWTPAEGIIPAGPELEIILDKPILNLGYYAQFSSGKLLGDAFKAVLGVRLDRCSFDYIKDIYDAAKPTGSKSYSNTSPRVALIFTPHENLAIKAMFGSAFRAPAPTEVGGANTYTLGSNIEGLKPETLTTAELAVDWILTKNLNWRTNAFRTKAKDQIAYSSVSNLVTNLYTLTTEGVETELFYGFSNWRGFVNYSFARRVDEEVQDPNVSPSDKLTWYPAHQFKLGAIYTTGPVSASLVGLYQGEIERRTSDFSETYAAYRPGTLGAWFTLDAKLTYTFRHLTSVSLAGKNLLNTDKNKLVKPSAAPFDFQGQERQVSVIFRTGF